MPVLPEVVFLRQIICIKIWFFLGKFDGIISIFSSNTDHLGKQFKILWENDKYFKKLMCKWNFHWNQTESV